MGLYGNLSRTLEYLLTHIPFVMLGPQPLRPVMAIVPRQLLSVALRGSWTKKALLSFSGCPEANSSPRPEAANGAIWGIEEMRLARGVVALFQWNFSVLNIKCRDSLSNSSSIVKQNGCPWTPWRSMTSWPHLKSSETDIPRFGEPKTVAPLQYRQSNGVSLEGLILWHNWRYYTTLW